MADSTALPASRAAFHRALHAWYREHHRRLPWREAPSLYKTVVSEFMLQQTQVATALPYFDRWLRALPDFSALAAASEAEVVKLWEGLGYYSRARNLRALAQQLVALPQPPRTPDGWREFPGIGPYTAAAVTSISFGAPAAVVDGNVVRILARLTNETRLFRDGGEAVKHFGPLATELLPAEDPGTHNQAMMELGATVCTRAAPQCLLCPVAKFCAARAHGNVLELPRFRAKVIERREVTRAWVVHDGRLLLHRGDAGARRLAGQHELPEAERLGAKPAHDSLLATKRRAITRFQFTELIHRVVLTAAARRRLARDPSLVWVPLDQLDSITISGPHRRWIHELLAAAAE